MLRTDSEKEKSGEVHILWDHDSAPMPTFCDQNGIVKELINLASQHGSKVNNIKVFTTERKNEPLSERRWKALESYNANIDRINSIRGKNHSMSSKDKVIMAELAILKSKPAGVCIFISDSTRFDPFINGLLKSNWKVIILYPNGTNKQRFENIPLCTLAPLEEIFKAVPSPIKPEEVVCKHYSKQYCGRRECGFLHICGYCLSPDHSASACKSVPKPNPVPYCGHFMRGHCNRGKQCKNNHTCPFCGKSAENSCSSETCKKLHRTPEALSKLPAPEPDPKKVKEMPKGKHCEANFFCQAGLACKNYHMPPEIECFKNNGGKGVEKFRTDLCKHEGNCNRRRTCGYAHNKSEYVCFYCAARGDHLGRACPVRDKNEQMQFEQETNSRQESKTMFSSSNFFIAQPTEKTKTIAPPTKTNDSQRKKRCEERFFCPEGSNCKNFHMPAELRCFENNFGQGIVMYRTDFCMHEENCERRSTCGYAHNQFEIVCFYCADRGNHSMRECPMRIEDELGLGITQEDSKTMSHSSNPVFSQSTDKATIEQQPEALVNSLNDSKNSVDKKSDVYEETSMLTLSLQPLETPTNETGNNFSPRTVSYKEKSPALFSQTPSSIEPLPTAVAETQIQPK